MWCERKQKSFIRTVFGVVCVPCNCYQVSVMWLATINLNRLKFNNKETLFKEYSLNTKLSILLQVMSLRCAKVAHYTAKKTMKCLKKAHKVAYHQSLKATIISIWTTITIPVNWVQCQVNKSGCLLFAVHIIQVSLTWLLLKANLMSLKLQICLTIA